VSLLALLRCRCTGPGSLGFGFLLGGVTLCLRLVLLGLALFLEVLVTEDASHPLPAHSWCLTWSPSSLAQVNELFSRPPALAGPDQGGRPMRVKWICTWASLRRKAGIPFVQRGQTPAHAAAPATQRHQDFARW